MRSSALTFRLNSSGPWAVSLNRRTPYTTKPIKHNEEVNLNMKTLFERQVSEACAELRKIKTQRDFYRIVNEVNNKYGCDVANAAREAVGCYNSAQYETESKLNLPMNMQEMTLEQILTLWDNTGAASYSKELATVRGWLMDEIKKRNPCGFDAWLDQDAPEEQDLRRFVTVNTMCLGCSLWRTDCAGTEQQVWTGCVRRR